MKSTIIILSLLLTSALLVPSIITLITSDNDTALFIDFNDEENNPEEKKEASEKDVFFHQWENTTLSIEHTSSSFISTYIEEYYSNSLEILLHPHKYKV